MPVLDGSVFLIQRKENYNNNPSNCIAVLKRLFTTRELDCHVAVTRAHSKVSISHRKQENVVPELIWPIGQKRPFCVAHYFSSKSKKPPKCRVVNESKSPDMVFVETAHINVPI